jgi:hypothetical protein
MQQARFFRGLPLPLWCSKFGGTNVPGTKRVEDLETANVRLKRLLVEAIPENVVTNMLRETSG